MKRCIYVMRDQVSGQYGTVFDCANDAECIRSFNNVVRSGSIPEHIVHDTIVVKLAEVDYSANSPVVTPVMPMILVYGSEVNFNE